MSTRTQFLPLPKLPHQGLWSAFFDKSIQAVLQARREPKAWAFCDSPQSALAWPLVVYETVALFVFHCRTADNGILQCYTLDPEFSSALLLALTLYADKPRDQWRFDRLLEEVERARYISSDLRESIPLLQWEEIVNEIGQLGPRVVGGKRYSNQFNKLLKARRHILAQWEKNIVAKAAFELNAYPLEVLPRQIFDETFHPPKPKKRVS